MTIVGQAELDIRAVGAAFSGDVQRVVKPGMYQAGTVMESTAARGRRAFGVMWDSFQQSADGALGPVTQMVDHVQGVAEELKHGSLGLRTAAAGAAGLGISTGLQMYGSKEQQAHQQLQASIENTGHYWEEYSKQVDGAVAAGQRMAVHNYDTMDALNRLVLATRNPERAIKDYNVVLAIAAARHMSVTSAAAMLASVYGGNTRMFRMFGMNVAAGNKELAAAASATKAHSTAVDKLKAARQALADTEARINASRQGHASTAAQVASAEASVASARASVASANFQHGSASPQAAAAAARLSAAEQRLTEVRGKGTDATKLTVAQQIELRKAHEKVSEAQKNVTSTTKDLTAAHKAAAGATTDVQKHVDDLQQRLSGQYTAAVRNFGTEVHSMGVELEDALGGVGAKYGPGLTAISTGLLATGTLMQGGVALFSRFSAGGRAAVAMNEVFAETTAAQVDATNVSTEASMSSLRAQALLSDEEIAASAEGSAEQAAAAWAVAESEMEGSVTAAAATADSEFVGMGAASEGAAAASSASWAGAMGKMGIGLAAFTASYMATTELLKHTPLGKFVAEGADEVAKLLHLFPNTDPYKNLKQSPQLGQGKLKGYVVGPLGYFDPAGHEHSWADAPANLQGQRQKWTGEPPGWHPPMAPWKPTLGSAGYVASTGAGSMPAGWHPPMLAPGQHVQTSDKEVAGGIHGLRTDVLRVVNNLDRELRVLEGLPQEIGRALGGGRHHHRLSSPSLGSLW